ncbi:hypothetical protein D3C76_430800 [compost metagenome]
MLAKPQIAGSVPARVTSNEANDPYGHIDLEGRYKVNFLFSTGNAENEYGRLLQLEDDDLTSSTENLRLARELLNEKNDY